MKVRTEVLGAEHVRGQSAQDPSTPTSSVHHRDGLGHALDPPGPRSADPQPGHHRPAGRLGRPEELELHFRASKNIGVDPKEIAEV